MYYSSESPSSLITESLSVTQSLSSLSSLSSSHRMSSSDPFFRLRNRQKLVRIRFGCGLDSRIYGNIVEPAAPTLDVAESTRDFTSLWVSYYAVKSVFHLQFYSFCLPLSFFFTSFYFIITPSYPSLFLCAICVIYIISSYFLLGVGNANVLLNRCTKFKVKRTPV